MSVDVVAWARALGALDSGHLSEHLGVMFQMLVDVHNVVELMRTETVDAPDPALTEALAAAVRASMQAAVIISDVRRQVST